MTTYLKRNVGLTLAIGVLLLAGSTYFGSRVFAHTFVATCPTPTGCASVPTTFTLTVPLGAGTSFPIPIPSGNHDLRVVVAVVPNAAEKEKDKDHGVGAVDIVFNSALVPDTRASWTGIDGHGKVLSESNVALSVGDVIFDANSSGTISLQYGGTATGGYILNVTNAGTTGRPVAIRWIH